MNHFLNYLENGGGQVKHDPNDHHTTYIMSRDLGTPQQPKKPISDSITCNQRPTINASCEADPRRVPLMSSSTPPPWNRLPIDELRPPRPDQLSFISEQDYANYYERQQEEYRQKYYQRDQLLRLSEEVLHKFDHQNNKDRPIQPDQISPDSSYHPTFPLTPEIMLGNPSPIITGNPTLNHSRPKIILPPHDDVISISSQEVEWTPVDSAYGAACPIFGCMPKHIRRAIETTLISFLFLSFILFFVILSVQLTNQHQGGHGYQPNSNIVTNDDYYVSNSGNVQHDDGYYKYYEEDDDMIENVTSVNYDDNDNYY